MADKKKRPVVDKKKPPQRLDLKNPDGKFGRLIQIGGTAIVVIFAVALVFYIVRSGHDNKPPPPPAATGEVDTVRVKTDKLVTKPGSADPKAVMQIYEDFLCPVCGDFERRVGPTMNKLIDIGAIEVDYSILAILDDPMTHNDYSSRAGAAALCVADESIDAFRRFHTQLFKQGVQPDESGKSFPDNAKLIEVAREAGVPVGPGDKVPGCINSGKYVAKVAGAAAAAKVTGTPTILINGERYYPPRPPTPDDLVAKIKAIVGDVPGIDTASSPGAS